jgi:hypothetical protein
MKLERFLPVIAAAFLVLSHASRADLIYTPASDVLLLLVLLIVANFAVNIAVMKGMAYVFRGFRRKAKLNEIARIGAITLIGFIADFFAFAVSGNAAFVGIFVFIVASLASYFLFFGKTLERNQAIISSIVFGIISNPAWIILYLP